MAGKTDIKWPEMRRSIILCWQYGLLQVLSMEKAAKTALWSTKKISFSLFNSGIGSRLPAAYKKFYDEWKQTPAPVHYRPYEGCKWQRNSNTGEVKRIENVPLPLRFPKEFHDVFTGGEAIVQGLQRRKPKFFKRVPHFWTPKLNENVVYSEILDKYFSVISTRRLLDLIIENEGFDNYILKTKACDLRSFIALKFKQRLLKAINNKQFPYDEEKNEKLYEKYKKYLIPAEEIEWYGLTFTEACAKQERIEKEQAAKLVVPLKQYYRTELIKYLKENPQSPESSELSKMCNVLETTSVNYLNIKFCCKENLCSVAEGRYILGPEIFETTKTDEFFREKIKKKRLELHELLLPECGNKKFGFHKHCEKKNIQ